MKQVDVAHFRELLARFATGVTVLTARGPDSTPVGLTVNSVTSVSLDPPLLSVCIDERHPMNETLKQAADFVLNVLASDQEAMSRRFAAKGDSPFQGVGYRPSERGTPILDGCIAFYECDITSHSAGGDHTVFVARVVGGAVQDGRPLVFYRGGYTSLGPE